MSAYSGLTSEAEATTKYDCHAYAWDGGIVLPVLRILRSEPRLTNCSIR